MKTMRITKLAGSSLFSHWSGLFWALSAILDQNQRPPEISPINHYTKLNMNMADGLMILVVLLFATCLLDQLLQLQSQTCMILELCKKRARRKIKRKMPFQQ